MSAIKLPERLFHRLPAGGRDDPAPSGPAPGRRRHVRNVILFCWALILLKSVAVLWAVAHYHLPFNPLWVIGPTVSFAALATLVFVLWKD